MEQKNISILGSTGSIGVSTIDLVQRHPDRFKVLGLAAGTNMEVLAKQIRDVKPLLVSVKSDHEKDKLMSLLSVSDQVEILVGVEGAEAVASIENVDIVISAIVGAAGLLPTLKAIQLGKTIGLANKESMVIAGELMAQEAAKSGSVILPVDSEHSALFQCLEGHRDQDVHQLILTASGGPFFQKPQNEFSSITKAQALKHPNWDMGQKITIDSATMMNKGLEVMEAHWLFRMPVEKISVCVHPQSIIHSMVEYIDGSVIAQLGVPDMKVPIAYALSYPERVETGVAKLDLFKQGQLTFFEPDFVKFPCLQLAFDVAKQGLTYPAVLNASNEIAVEAFLKDQIHFTQIPDLIKNTLDTHTAKPISSLDDVLHADAWTREYATHVLKKLAA